jgi:hypothetical protein
MKKDKQFVKKQTKTFKSLKNYVSETKATNNYV